MGFGLAIILAFLVISLQPVGFELILTPLQGNKPLLRLPLEPRGCFTIYYRHSVNGYPVWDIHTIDNQGKIYLKEERFLAFSAGMGHWPGHGRHVIRDDYQVLEDINKPIGSFVLRVGGLTSQQTIICGEMEVNLSQLAAGKPVRVSAISVSRMNRLLRRIFPPAASIAHHGGV